MKPKYIIPNTCKELHHKEQVKKCQLTTLWSPDHFPVKLEGKLLGFCPRLAGFGVPRCSLALCDTTRFGPLLRNNRFKRCELVKHFHITATSNLQILVKTSFYKDTAKIRKVSLEASTG